MILTVTLNPAIDLSMDVPNWEPGEVNRATMVRKVVGGKGINVSRVLKDQGVPTVVMTIIGNDSVGQFHTLGRQYGFPIVYITVPGEVRTNVHLYDPEQGRLLKVNQSGSPLGQSYFNHFKLLYKQQMGRATMVVMAGSLPPGCATDTYGELCRLAQDSGVPAVVDAEGEVLLASLAEKPYLVKPNRTELEASLKTSLDSQKEVIEAGRELLARGAQRVIITDGPKEIIGFWDGKAYFVTPPKVVTHGTTGAGDSFAAGFVAGVKQKKSFAESLCWGVAASAATCEAPEGELASLQATQRLLKGLSVREDKLG